MNEDDKVILAFDQDQEDCMLIEEGRKVSRINVIEEVNQTKVVYDKEYREKHPCMPRPPPKFMAKKERIKTPWDFFKSVFKGKTKWVTFRLQTRHKENLRWLI